MNKFFSISEEDLEELEEELSLEDFEDFEDDESSGFDESIEYNIYPMAKDILTKIPDNINPEKILKKKEIVLYNPKKITSPYTPSSGKKINFGNVCKELILTNRREISIIKSNKKMAQQQKLILENHKSLEDRIKRKLIDKQKGKPAYKPKNKNNSNKRK